MRVCIPKVGSGRKFTTEARRTPGVRDRMSATLIGRFDRINRMSTRCMRDGNHPVDPVHPVKTSSSSGKVGKVIGELHCSVPPCFRGQSLPTFLMHTRVKVVAAFARTRGARTLARAATKRGLPAFWRTQLPLIFNWVDHSLTLLRTEGGCESRRSDRAARRSPATFVRSGFAGGPSRPDAVAPSGCDRRPRPRARGCAKCRRFRS